VNKTDLTELIQRFPSSTPDESEQVLALCLQYPYCQIFHGLAARMSSDHNLPNNGTLLQEAAIRCTDRTVLKELMELKPKVTDSPVTVATPVGETHDFADEVVEDLQRLKHAKEIFESMFGDSGKPQRQQEKTGKAKREILKSKKQRIVEMAKALAKPDNSTPSPTQSAQPKARKTKRKSQADELIESIKTSHKKIEPENERTKEQIEIIDQFIKSKPVIMPPQADAGETKDMSESIKSGEFSDNIVSETLVEILLKQGKKDKAIEVLKKLIWKFPQKKTYFAARIDDLKK
jgi:hypothetical protein